jgi:MFS family permease
VAVYIFGQQLGSILGLILGGYIADGIGWRWSSPIVAIAAVWILSSLTELGKSKSDENIGCPYFAIRIYIRRYNVPTVPI